MNHAPIWSVIQKVPDRYPTQMLKILRRADITGLRIAFFECNINSHTSSFKDDAGLMVRYAERHGFLCVQYPCAVAPAGPYSRGSRTGDEHVLWPVSESYPHISIHTRKTIVSLMILS